ncbi:hypothetical protein [Pseudomonas sp. 34 E 7]|nr:hypothetical protein [Pseudomonas sp. 34 E 7]
MAMGTMPTDNPTPANAASNPAYTDNTTLTALQRSSSTPPSSEPRAPPILKSICTMPAWGLLKPCSSNSDGSQFSSMYITVKVKK